MDATLTRLLQLLAQDDGQSLPRIAKKLALRHSQLHRLLTAVSAGDDLRGIIVISGEVTRTRRVQLLSGGATEVIHKDDVDSVRLTEAMVLVFSR